MAKRGNLESFSSLIFWIASAVLKNFLTMTAKSKFSYQFLMLLRIAWKKPSQQ